MIKAERLDFGSDRHNLRSRKPALGFEKTDLGSEQVAQGQYVVSDTHCPALSDCELE